MTALLACFLATAAVLHASAAGGAAVEYQSASACPDAHGPTVTSRMVALEDVPAIIETARRHAAEHGFGRAQVAMYTWDLPGVEFGGNTYTTRLGYTDNRHSGCRKRDLRRTAEFARHQVRDVRRRRFASGHRTAGRTR